MKAKRTHFDPFDEGLRSACGVEDRGNWRGGLTVTADVTKVDCLSCRATPEFDAAELISSRDNDQLAWLAHDRLLLVEPKDHRTIEQVRAWSVPERAEVAVWAGRRHLRASDNPIVVPFRPRVMDRDPEPVIQETADIFGPHVCFCPSVR